MEENNTIIELNEALGELLDAYDTLKSENQELEEIIEDKSREIEELTQQNNDLHDKVQSLTTTTKHHSSELDTMLGRIKSTLGSFEKKNTENIEPENNTQDILEEEEPQLFEEKTQQVEEPETPKKEGSKEIDLGRMQSLLNGFNN